MASDKLTSLTDRFNNMSKEEALEFLIRAGIVRPKERTLEGQEKEEMMLILKFLTPTDSSNNQRFWTDEYTYGDNQYFVTYFDENDYEVVEIKP